MISGQTAHGCAVDLPAGIWKTVSMKQGRVEKIETIKKRFANKKVWMLIDVTEYDKSTTTPVRGRLLAHSPDPDEIDRVAMKERSPKRMLMTACSDERIPEDMAVCISVWPAWT